MNVPPAAPPPMSVPAPAPAPQKSGALKWILIGCGGVAFIGLLVCGGCFLWGANMVKSALKIQEEVETLVENNAEVKEAIGNIKKMEQVGDQDRDSSSSEVVFTYRITGSKGEGTANARVRFTFTKFELKTATFETSDGRSIKLK